MECLNGKKNFNSCDSINEQNEWEVFFGFILFYLKKTNFSSFLDVFYVSFVMKKKDITEFWTPGE